MDLTDETIDCNQLISTIEEIKDHICDRGRYLFKITRKTSPKIDEWITVDKATADCLLVEKKRRIEANNKLKNVDKKNNVDKEVVREKDSIERSEREIVLTIEDETNQHLIPINSEYRDIMERKRPLKMTKHSPLSKPIKVTKSNNSMELWKKRKENPIGNTNLVSVSVDRNRVNMPGNSREMTNNVDQISNYLDRMSGTRIQQRQTHKVHAETGQPDKVADVQEPSNATNNNKTMKTGDESIENMLKSIISIARNLSQKNQTTVNEEIRHMLGKMSKVIPITKTKPKNKGYNNYVLEKPLPTKKATRTRYNGKEQEPIFYLHKIKGRPRGRAFSKATESQPATEEIHVSRVMNEVEIDSRKEHRNTISEAKKRQLEGEESHVEVPPKKRGRPIERPRGRTAPQRRAELRAQGKYCPEPIIVKKVKKSEGNLLIASIENHKVVNDVMEHILAHVSNENTSILRMKTTKSLPTKKATRTRHNGKEQEPTLYLERIKGRPRGRTVSKAKGSQSDTEKIHVTPDINEVEISPMKVEEHRKTLNTATKRQLDDEGRQVEIPPKKRGRPPKTPRGRTAPQKRAELRAQGKYVPDPKTVKKGKEIYRNLFVAIPISTCINTHANLLTNENSSIEDRKVVNDVMQHILEYVSNENTSVLPMETASIEYKKVVSEVMENILEHVSNENTSILPT